MAGLSFDLPFLPDASYVELLLQEQARVRHLYFGLGLQDFPDARPWQQDNRNLNDDFCEKLALFPQVRKNVLLNGRISDARVYLDAATLAPLVRTLERLVEQDLLQGLVIADFYLAQALADTAPGLCKALAATPSVNCQIDSLEKAMAWLERLPELGFQPAGLLIPDRSLNRSLHRLQAVAQQLRTTYPQLEIYLLANEGCLYQCPYRRAHEVLIAGCRDREERFRALGKLHSVRGCARRFFEAPWELLKSPCIRPEDLPAYEGIADGIKVCGRTLGAGQLSRIVRAYCAGSWEGNLIELLDASEGLAEVFSLPNQRIPRDFLEHAGTCDKRCAACGYCPDLARRLMSRSCGIR